MKRKTFILSAVAAAAVISVPIVSYRMRHWLSQNPLTTPDTLAHFCDENKLREMGQHYRNKVPAENSRSKLSRMLLQDARGKLMPADDEAAVTSLVEEKIQQDFLADRIIILEGWVVSATEARQCALFSLV